MMPKLVNLAWVFALLSILAVGGGTAVLPEMHYMTVAHFHWISDKQFRDIYSLGQVAPGPNMLMVMVIGYRLAGAAGAAVVGLAFFIPGCILTFYVDPLLGPFSRPPLPGAARGGVPPGGRWVAVSQCAPLAS